MPKSRRNGADTNTIPRVRSETGQTHDGSPLAKSFPPSPDLQPWFAWFNVTIAEMPADEELHCGMLNDLPCMRILFDGHWTAETRLGQMEFKPGKDGMALFFGPHSKVMPISVSGSFTVINVQLAPGTSYRLGGPAMPDALDAIFDHDKLAGHGRLASRFDPKGTPQEWLASFEYELRKFIRIIDASDPDVVSRDFDLECLADPAFSLAQFAEEHDITARTLERAVKRTFGLSPKQVMRRARALDMVSALLGVAMEEDEAEARLRYFDQSHLIREVKHFFDMTPSQLRSDPHPMLRLSLETRQVRKLKALDLLRPGETPPWRDPNAEPSGSLRGG